MTTFLMKLLSPACEAQRREYRKARDAVEAHAIDLSKTIQADSADLQRLAKNYAAKKR